MTTRHRAPDGTAARDFLALAALETDDHVLWPWSFEARGYGQVWYQGHRYKTHQLALRLRTPRPGPKFGALHAAGCPRHCMNYRHLRWGTPTENVRDARLEGTIARGETHGAVKLTDAQVREIRQRYAVGGISQYQLADEYGVTQSTVSVIVNRRRWSHVA